MFGRAVDAWVQLNPAARGELVPDLGRCHLPLEGLGPGNDPVLLGKELGDPLGVLHGQSFGFLHPGTSDYPQSVVSRLLDRLSDDSAATYPHWRHSGRDPAALVIKFPARLRSLGDGKCSESLIFGRAGICAGALRACRS